MACHKRRSWDKSKTLCDIWIEGSPIELLLTIKDDEVTCTECRKKID